jgi:hypothetical protein
VPAGIPALILGAPPEAAPPEHVAARAWPFPQDPDGAYAAGFPMAGAIAQLEESRRRGAVYLVIPPTAFEWLAARADLRRHVETRYRMLVEDDSCRVFDLRPSPIRDFLDAVLPDAEPVVAVVPDTGDLDLDPRPVRTVVGGGVPSADLLEELEQCRTEGLRFLVIAEMMPWGPPDEELVEALERRYARLTARPGLCQVLDLAGTAARNGESPTRWRRIKQVFGNG